MYKRQTSGSEASSGGEASADGVVVALPHYCVESVLPSGSLPGHIRPSELASSPIVNVHVHFDRRVTDLPFVAGIGTVAQWVFDRTASSGCLLYTSPSCRFLVCQPARSTITGVSACCRHHLRLAPVASPIQTSTSVRCSSSASSAMRAQCPSAR